MKKYSVSFAATAYKELDKLPGALAERVFDRIQALAGNPRPSGCKKLKGGVAEWRIRIGDYRVIYVIDDVQSRIDVTRIRHRRAVYQ